MDSKVDYTGKIVLEIGPGPKPQANGVFPGAKIVSMDVDEQYKPDILCNARRIPEDHKGKYDVVFASHVLEHFPWFESVNVMKEWASALKPGGELHVLVPSLDWIAKQLVSETPSRGTIPLLFGGITTQWDAHLAGFTMRTLRATFEAAGLRARRAASLPLQIMAMGTIVEVQQLYVMGVKEGDA